MGINIADLKMQSQRRNRSDFDLVSLLLILLAIGIVVGAVFFIFLFQESKVQEMINAGSPISTILVEQNGPKTEGWYLSFYNPATRKNALIAIPAKTRLKVDYEDRPTHDAVENIYARGGSTAVRRTVENLTGTTFPLYLVYDLTQAERLIDLLQGLQVIVPEKLTHIDPETGTYIQVPGGRQVLDGAKVKQLLQYRFGEQGAKSNMEYHRSVYSALLDRTEDIRELFSNLKTAGILTKDLDTNLSKKDFGALVGQMEQMNSSGILFYRMHGRDITIKDQQFITPVENGAWLRERIETVKRFLGDEGPAPIGDEIRMEILNGSSNPGQAQNLRNYFLEYGFNVVHFGNALRSDYENTMVIDRIGRPDLAKSIADIINCKEVYTRVDESLLVDVTIILGNDFEGKYVR
jgi:anionic cell wall polymer biosynthesis LytR-Cps2A-Psr (LCP) family protein